MSVHPISSMSGFEALMRRYNQRLYRVARAILKDEVEAEDAVQQTWLAAFRHMAEFRGEAELSTWLTRIAINESLGRLRRRRGDQPNDGSGELEQLPDHHDNPEDDVSRRELVGLLEQAIDGLPDAYRVVFVLREVEGLSTAEAATSLELTEEAVRVRLHRARGLLRGELERRVGSAAPEVFAFAGERCDRIVARVLGELGEH